MGIVSASIRSVMTVLLCSVALRAAADPKPLKSIVLVNAGTVDAEVLQRLQRFASNELGISIRTLSVAPVPARNLHDGSSEYAKNLGTNDFAMVVLASPEDEKVKHLVVLPDVKVAVVNGKALAAKDPETYARRLERQVMRSIAFLLGLPQSPEPRDVTRSYTSLEDLDKMGRNFSAPWLTSFETAARAAGLLPPVPTSDTP